MKDYYGKDPDPKSSECLRLEAVTVSVGFDDILDVTLRHNHPQVDTLIVVTAHDDVRTQQVARKHGAICVPTDLFSKNQRKFNKGAAINAGFNYFQYHGWRMHLDCDIVLPDNFRRLVFNHHHLDRDCIYGADRVDAIGVCEVDSIRKKTQHHDSLFVSTHHHRPLGSRYVDTLEGWLPLGFFQFWHCSCQKPYPYSLGTAAHDDIMFSALWPKDKRLLLPGVIVTHLNSEPGKLGQNWEGRRSQRLE